MKKELIKALNDYADENGASELADLKNEKIGDFIVSAQEVRGGCEGAGEEHWVVLKVEHVGKTSFWKVPGWYQSYHGAELEIDNTFEVVAKEVTVTVWEKK